MTSKGILPPSGRAIATPRMAGFKSEWPRSNRNRWPTSFRNQWPACSGISSRNALRQRARSSETPSSSRPRVGPPQSPASSSAVPRSRTVACVSCSKTSEPIRLSYRRENRPHHRQRASGSRSSSSAAVTGNPPRFKGTSVWLVGTNAVFRGWDRRFRGFCKESRGIRHSEHHTKWKSNNPSLTI